MHTALQPNAAAPTTAAPHINVAAPIQRPDNFKQIEIGRIRNVGSSVATIAINKSVIRNNQLNLAQIGTILKIITHKSVVVAMVSSLRIGSEDDEGMSDGCIAQLNIMGEITTNETTRQTRFFRGVRSFPVLGAVSYTHLTLPTTPYV